MKLKKKQTVGEVETQIHQWLLLLQVELPREGAFSDMKLYQGLTRDLMVLKKKKITQS